MSKPYEAYVDKALSDVLGRGYSHVFVEQLPEMLADAWMDGLKYSLVMIESEKRSREK